MPRIRRFSSEAKGVCSEAFAKALRGAVSVSVELGPSIQANDGEDNRGRGLGGEVGGDMERSFFVVVG